MENENAQKSRSNVGAVWTIVIIVIIIIAGLIYYYHSENTAGNSSSSVSGTVDTGTVSAGGASGPMIPYYTLTATSSPTLDTYLIAANGMTLYTYAQDTAGNGQSACTGSCATQWPPYTVASSTGLAAGPSLTGQLGTITRTDGTTQVTYNGKPVYFWYQDVNPGDTGGNGIGNVWYVAKP